jgi:methylmalonic aciduria homocystinuria type C protein
MLERAAAELIESARGELRRGGLDLATPFSSELLLALELDAFLVPPRRLGLLIGNTRELWPHFRAAQQREATLEASKTSLDDYVEQHAKQALTRAAPSLALQWFWSHVIEPRPFPIQRLAELAGLAQIGPAGLCVHPLHGPWIALRAAVILDLPAPEPTAALQPRPCDDCAAPCVPALERAQALSGSPPDSASIARHAPAWIAVRDACPLGRSSRYGDEQLAHHYGTKPAART